MTFFEDEYDPDRNDINLFVSVDEAAKIAARPISTVRRWAAKGKKVYAVKIGGNWLIHRYTIPRRPLDPKKLVKHVVGKMPDDWKDKIVPPGGGGVSEKLYQNP